MHSLWHAPTASSFQSTHFPGVSRIALLESNTSLTYTEQYTNFHNDISSAFGYQTNAVIQPSSGPVVDLTTSGVEDSGRAANFLRHSMNNEIDPAPHPVVIGETVAANNKEMLVSAKLLTLQVHVGDANIGLRRRFIRALLRGKRYQTEMKNCNYCCCICLDSFGIILTGTKLGELDCGH